MKELCSKPKRDARTTLVMAMGRAPFQVVRLEADMLADEGVEGFCR